MGEGSVSIYLRGSSLFPWLEKSLTDTRSRGSHLWARASLWGEEAWSFSYVDEIKDGFFELYQKFKG